MSPAHKAPVLLWFKRDLRVLDHPALAAAGAYVLPVYIIEPEYWALPDTSARQWAFTAEALESLRADLAAMGQPLIVRMGDAVTELARLCKAQGITQMISHEETGNGWTYARDKRVAAWAAASGVRWQELPQSGVVRRLRSRDGWQGQRNAFMRAAPADPPQALAPLSRDISTVARLPDARALRLAPDPCPHRQNGSRTAADRALDSFLSVRGERYRVAMSSPLTAERACSRLSPYLALGVLSVRQVEQARVIARAQHQGQRDWQAALNSFAKRLAWRDHFIQKLEDEPGIEHHCLHRAHEGLRPARGRCCFAARMGTGRNRRALCRRLYALSARNRLAEFSDAGNADVLCQLSFVAGLARYRPCAGAAVHRLRTGYPLVAGADAIGHDRDQYDSHL